MSVFDLVIGTIKKNLSENLETKILQLCAQIDDDLVILKGDDHKLSVQGSLMSLNDLESKIKALTKLPSKEREDVTISDTFCKSRKVSGIEAKSLGILPEEKKTKNRDDKLPFRHCDQCSFKTKRPNHLAKHMKRHENNPGQIVQCKDCDFKCIRVEDLAKHSRKDHSKSKRPYLPCNLCSYSAQNKRLLERHKVNHHVPADHIDILECEKCDYKTIKASFMARHLQKHEENKPEKPKSDVKSMNLHKCQDCSYITSKVSNFLRHQLTHSNDRKHLCITCGMSFKRSDTLKQHLAVHGLSTSKYCDLCGKACRSQSHLIDHKATHSDLRNILCHICGMAFKTKATQLRHLKTVHDNQALQKCMHCGQKVSSLQSLNRHLRTFHADKEALDINDQMIKKEGEEEEENDEEPVIYTLDLSHETNAGLENNLQYLINESGGSLIISTNTDLT